MSILFQERQILSIGQKMVNKIWFLELGGVETQVSRKQKGLFKVLNRIQRIS